MIDDLAVAIVAGGTGRRMGGVHKALIEVDGVAIIERQLAVLRQIASDIVVAANDSEPFAGLGVPVIPDRAEGAGPIAGILAALMWSPAGRVLCVACDMPFLDPGVLRLIASRASADVDIAAPRIDSRPQPLCAVYSRRCAPVVSRRLGEVKLRVSDLLTESGVRVAWIDDAEIRTIDPRLSCFINVNTPADLP